jgi:hypothetical protein
MNSKKPLKDPGITSRGNQYNGTLGVGKKQGANDLGLSVFQTGTLGVKLET